MNTDRPTRDAKALARSILRAHQLRGQHFDPRLSDVAWAIMLDLYVHEPRRTSVSAACAGSGFPATTALRWIAVLTAAGLVLKLPDPGDERRTWIALTDKARSALEDWLHRLQ